MCSVCVVLSPATWHAMLTGRGLAVFPRDARDEYIVIACDGVFDVLRDFEVVDAVTTQVKTGETDMGHIAKHLVQTSFDRGSRDNISCMVVRMPGAPVPPMYARCGVPMLLLHAHFPRRACVACAATCRRRLRWLSRAAHHMWLEAAVHLCTLEVVVVAVMEMQVMTSFVTSKTQHDALELAATSCGCTMAMVATAWREPLRPGRLQETR